MHRAKKNFLFIDLYTTFYINKVSLLLMLVFILLMILVFVSSSSLGMTDKQYIMEKDNIVNGYFTESFFAISVINGIFTIFLGSLENSSGVNKFDVFFIPNQKRGALVNYKIIAYTIMIIVFYTLEFMMLFLIPSIMYEDFVFKLEYLAILGNLIIAGLFTLNFSFFLSLKINNSFSLLLALIAFFAMRMIAESNNDIIRLVCGYIFPILRFNNDISSYFTGGTIYVINMWVISYILIYISYCRKNIKNY